MTESTAIFRITPPEVLRGSVCLPASKSISNRALIINALACAATSNCSDVLADSVMLPQNLSDCDDTEVIVAALRERPAVIDIKAAGTAMRFMTAYIAATSHPSSFILTGTERMKHRPIAVLVNALRQIGADIEYSGEEGFPPLKISGRKLDGGSIEVPGDISSQYISALLMVAPVLRHGLELRLSGTVISRPYIDLTLWMMREFGAEADWTSGNTIVVHPKSYRRRQYTIESDWSAASYWYEMLALTSDSDAELHLGGLIDGSKQGDSAVRYIFSMLGVKTIFETEQQADSRAVLSRNNRAVSRLDYDFTNSPDLAQTLVTTCAARGIPFHFRGLSTLKIKETDRIEALKREMRKLGFVLRAANDSELIWDGERCQPTQEPIDTFDDHRMALAFAPLAFAFPGIRIRQPNVVTKSYPHFWDDLRSMGFLVIEE